MLARIVFSYYALRFAKKSDLCGLKITAHKKMPALVLDIGNTRSKLGLFQNNTLVEQANWSAWTLQELTDYGNLCGVENVIVSSVAEPAALLLEALQDQFRVLELTHQTPLPFRNDYRTPQTLGKDRLAAVAGAQAAFPGQNCLVVDCGTCIKYDLLLADGTYPGGNIAPGAGMRIKAMHHFTARLPEVTMTMPVDMTGYSTETALQNGALRGAVLEIEGFARLFRRQTNPLQVILTGGDADFFYPFLDIQYLIKDADLTLKGLNSILAFNTRNQKPCNKNTTL